MTTDGDPTLTMKSRRVLCPRGREAQLRSSQLRPGQTTGACACAIATSAPVALETDEFPGPVGIALPSGREATFVLTQQRLRFGLAVVAVTKDASDDPDVTHGVVIRVMAEPGKLGGSMRPAGGEDVGTITLPGLLLPVGKSTINPEPREYIAANITAAAEHLGIAPDVCMTVSIDSGARTVKKTWNSRIGVLRDLSVLGTTGAVMPYLCSTWIAPIHHGIDVAVAASATHTAACIGSTSKRVTEKLYPGTELPDVGDFAGTILKYLHKHPLPRLMIVGGAAKPSKLATGYLGLHSYRTHIQPDHLRQPVERAGVLPRLAEAIGEVAIAAHAVTLAGEAGIDLSQLITDSTRDEALMILDGVPVGVRIVVTGRAGKILAKVH